MNWSAQACDECTAESVHALSGSYASGLIRRVRPSEKSVDDAESVNVILESSDCENAPDAGRFQ